MTIQFNLQKGIYSLNSYFTFETSFQYPADMQLLTLDSCFPGSNNCNLSLDNKQILVATRLDELQTSFYKNKKCPRYNCNMLKIRNNLTQQPKYQDLPLKVISSYGKNDNFDVKVYITKTLKELFPCFKGDYVEVKQSLLINFDIDQKQKFFGRKNDIQTFFNSFEILGQEYTTINPDTYINQQSQAFLLTDNNNFDTLITDVTYTRDQQYNVFFHRILIEPAYIQSQQLKSIIRPIFQQEQANSQINTNIYQQSLCKKLKIILPSEYAKFSSNNIEQIKYWFATLYIGQLQAITGQNNALGVDDFSFSLKLNEYTLIKCNSFDQLVSLFTLGKKSINYRKNYIKIYLPFELQDKLNQIFISFSANNGQPYNVSIREFLIVEY